MTSEALSVTVSICYPPYGDAFFDVNLCYILFIIGLLSNYILSVDVKGLILLMIV